MKKLLIVGLSVAMGTALALGITACGKKGNSDADTAKEAIKTVTNLHASVGTETPTSYKVTGATRVGTQVVTVEWSVTSTYEGYADYVSVGEKGADQQVAINITQHEEDAIDYTLTASVTVGKATETKDFSHTIPAGGKIYTPSEAKTLAGTLDADAYYMEEGVVTAINVKGYVVAIEGGWNTQYNELQKVYIGDTAETAKTDALYVYYIDSDPVYMTKEFDVEVGDLITVRGALQNYKGNTPELTYNGTGESRIDPVIVAPIQKAPKTDAQILDDAKNALKINEYYSATGDYDLPVPIKDVTATWALEGGNNEYVKVEDGKLSVLKLPDTETSYKLTATLSYGTATPVKAEFTIKLGKLALTHAGTEADPFTPAEALTIAATLADKQYYSDTNGVKAVYVKGKVVDVGTWSGGNYNNYNKVYIIAEDAYTATATKDTTGAILVYRIASDPQLTEGTLKHGDTLLLLCGIQRYGETYELGSTKGSSDSSNSATLVTYTPGVDERTAQEKVNDALEALADTFTVTQTGDTALPASTVTGVTFAWSTEDKTYTITGNKIKVDALPTADATVTATVTATCGTETVTNNTKTVTITIKAASEEPEPNKYGTKDEPLSVAEALALAEEECASANDVTEQIVYATGIALSTPAKTSSYYSQFELRDETDTNKKILVYSINLDANVPAIAQNDIIIIYGYIKNYSGTIEFASNNNTYVYCASNTRGTSTITLGEHTGATVTGLTETQTKTNGTEVSFTVTAEQGKKIASVKAGTVTLEAEEENTYKFTVAGDVTVTVETVGEGEVLDEMVTLSFADKAQRTTQTTSQQVWSQNSITFTNDKGSATSNVADYANPARCYKGSSIKVEYTKAMNKIVFHCASGSNNKYATALVTSIGTQEGVTVTRVENDVTVTFTTAQQTFTVATLSDQVRINSLDVYYTPASATVQAPAQVAILPGKEF